MRIFLSSFFCALMFSAPTFAADEQLIDELRYLEAKEKENESYMNAEKTHVRFLCFGTHGKDVVEIPLAFLRENLGERNMLWTIVKNDREGKIPAAVLKTVDTAKTCIFLPTIQKKHVNRMIEKHTSQKQAEDYLGVSRVQKEKKVKTLYLMDAHRNDKKYGCYICNYFSSDWVYMTLMEHISKVHNPSLSLIGASGWDHVCVEFKDPTVLEYLQRQFPENVKSCYL